MGEKVYEMKIPAGITESQLAEVITTYDLELIQTEYGPVLQGEIEKLENARDHIVKALNERIKELEGNSRDES
ncbi:MAG: hypothetical protein K8E24_002440 [Methanobacterium paludis]|nr:hypothetical protein [Methanobacterium paludis]